MTSVCAVRPSTDSFFRFIQGGRCLPKEVDARAHRIGSAGQALNVRQAADFECLTNDKAGPIVVLAVGTYSGLLNLLGCKPGCLYQRCLRGLVSPIIARKPAIFLAFLVQRCARMGDGDSELGT